MSQSSAMPQGITPSEAQHKANNQIAQQLNGIEAFKGLFNFAGCQFNGPVVVATGNCVVTNGQCVATTGAVTIYNHK